MRLLNQPQLLSDQINKDGLKSTQYLQENLDRTGNAILKKKKEADRMLEAYKIGVIDMDTLKEKVAKIKDEEAKLIQEKARLEVDLNKAKTSCMNEAKLREFCHSLPSVLDGLDFNSRRSILKEVVEKIEIDGNNANIYGILPLPKDNPENVAIDFQASKYPGMTLIRFAGMTIDETKTLNFFFMICWWTAAHRFSK